MRVVRHAVEENDKRVTMNLVGRYIGALIRFIGDFAPTKGALLQNAIFFGVSILIYSDAAIFLVNSHLLVFGGFGIFR